MEGWRDSPKKEKRFWIIFNMDDSELSTEHRELRSQLEATERHLTIAREERTAAQNDAAALRSQLEASQAECAYKQDVVISLVSERDSAISEGDRLRKSLFKHGRHGEDCPKTARECTCGFRAAIDAAMQPASGEKVDQPTESA